MTDMEFATKFGYKKLLPLSGFTTKEQVVPWSFKDEYKPDFYVDSLKSLNEIIQSLNSKL